MYVKDFFPSPISLFHSSASARLHHHHHPRLLSSSASVPSSLPPAISPSPAPLSSPPFPRALCNSLSVSLKTFQSRRHPLTPSITVFIFLFKKKKTLFPPDLRRSRRALTLTLGCLASRKVYIGRPPSDAVISAA